MVSQKYLYFLTVSAVAASWMITPPSSQNRSPQVYMYDHTIAVSSSASSQSETEKPSAISRKFTEEKPSIGSEKSALRKEELWRTGLAQYRNGDMISAARFFSQLYENEKDALNASDRAAVAFWAYRAFATASNKDAAVLYLDKAARESLGFYSIIARHIIGQETISHDLHADMLIDAARNDNEAVAYPVPQWQPASGYKLEQALLLAVMRQESRFEPDARGAGGAFGVMQLMPTTASAMKRDIKLSGSMIDPSINMALGQRYLSYLMENDNIGNNLIFLLAAYNAGPGTLQRWQTTLDYRQDPLLFVESITYGTTRDYVINVIGNYWVYSELFGHSVPSVDMIATGNWPLYEHSEKRLAFRINKENRP